MRKLLAVLKKKNRTLLEMHMGMLFYGLACQLLGMLFFFTRILKLESPFMGILGLWCGIGAAMVSAWHIYRTLDRSLDYGEAATKLIFKGYMIRYVLIILIMLIMIMTEILHPLILFLGYMSLKVAALLQPFTHKICNRLFHETDPKPQSIEDPEEVSQEREDVLA